MVSGVWAPQIFIFFMIVGCTYRLDPNKNIDRYFIGKMVVPLGWRAPSCLSFSRSPLKGDDIPNKCQLYKGCIILPELIINGSVPS